MDSRREKSTMANNWITLDNYHEDLKHVKYHLGRMGIPYEIHPFVHSVEIKDPDKYIEAVRLLRIRGLKMHW